MSLCHDLKDLVQEFYRLELVVIVNENSSSETQTNGTSNASSDLCAAIDLAAAASSIAPSSNPLRDYLNNSAAVSSPSTFINRHTSRFKSKLNGQNILPSSPQQHPTSSVSIITGRSSWNIIKNNLIILANAAAIELYFLCVEDEQDADRLCTKCAEKFFINSSLTETISQAPLIASCIQVLGRLALKFPNLSKISVRHLSDFLTEPSPILLKQYKHIVEKVNTLKPAKTVPYPTVRHPEGASNHNKTLSTSTNNGRFVVTSAANPEINQQTTRSLSKNQIVPTRSGASFSKSTRIFEFLRDLTIECLCLYEFSLKYILVKTKVLNIILNQLVNIKYVAKLNRFQHE